MLHYTEVSFLEGSSAHDRRERIFESVQTPVANLSFLSLTNVERHTDFMHCSLHDGEAFEEVCTGWESFGVSLIVAFWDQIADAVVAV